MRFKGFIGAAYTLDSLNMDSQQCVNMYPVIDESGNGKEGEVAYLQGTPGMVSGYSLPANISTLYLASNGELYFSNKSTLYKLNSDGSVRNIGFIEGTNQSYSMADNGVQLIIVTGSKGYVVGLKTLLMSEITSVGFIGSDYVIFFDNYMILNKPGTNILYLSSLGDATTYDPLDQFSVDSTPEPILRHINLHREVWIFKNKTVDVYYNTGNVATPFQREGGIFIERGTIAPNSIVKINNTVIWIGSSSDGFGTVYMANGYEPTPVSTFHVSRLIALEPNPTSIQAWGYEEGGHTFYSFNLSDTTLTLDLTTNMWHERQSTNPNKGTQSRYEVFDSVIYLNRILVASTSRPTLYFLDKTVGTDGGNMVLRIRSSPHVSSALSRILHKSIQLDIQTGEGTSDILVDTSDDNARTWYTRQVSMGSLGKYKHRVKVNKLGSSRNRVYRVRYSGTPVFALIGAELDLEKCQS